MGVRGTLALRELPERQAQGPFPRSLGLSETPWTHRKSDTTNKSPLVRITAAPVFCNALRLAKTHDALYHPVMKRDTLSFGLDSASLQDAKKALRADLRTRRRALSAKQRHKLSLAAQKNILESSEWESARSVALYMAMPEETDTELLLRTAWEAGKHVQLPYCIPQKKGHMEFYACSGLHELQPGPFGILEPHLPAIAARQAQGGDAAPENGPEYGKSQHCRSQTVKMGPCLVPRKDLPALDPAIEKALPSQGGLDLYPGQDVGDSPDAALSRPEHLKSPDVSSVCPLSQIDDGQPPQTCRLPENDDTGPFALPAPPPDLIIVPGVAFDLSGHRLGMGGGYYDRLFARPEYIRAMRIGLAFGFQAVDYLPGEDWDRPVHALSTERELLWIQRP